MMAEFAAGLDDSWGLQAIVGGGLFSSGSSSVNVMDLPNKDDFLFSFPDMFFETRSPPLTTTDELGVYDQPLTMIPVTGGSPSNSSSSAEVHEEKSAEQKQTCTAIVQSGAVVTSYVPKYKLRRKNQQKRVVLQMTAEDLSSDIWAWRKYGQKPIKGSPYPRSYYRCSSTKGCLARRQVEQSCTDASTYIVTYSGEHNHSQPTRKNALAGTIRHKFPNPKSPSAPPPPPSSAASSSPASSSNTSTGAVDVQLSPAVPRNVREEMMIMEEMVDNNNNDNNNVIFSGINLDDDFFSGLEDIDDLISELSNGRHCLTNKEQFPGNS